MPEAIAAGGDNNLIQDYYFTINGTVEEVEKYYQTEMTTLGWAMTSCGHYDPGNTTSLWLEKGSDFVVVTIIPGPGEILEVALRADQ